MEDGQQDDSILSELVDFYSDDAHDDVLYRALAEYERATTSPPVPLAGKTCSVHSI